MFTNLGIFEVFFNTNVFTEFKRRQGLLFGSQTFKDVEEWRPGHTNAKKSKRVTLTSIKEKGAAHIDA